MLTVITHNVWTQVLKNSLSLFFATFCLCTVMSLLVCMHVYAFLCLVPPFFGLPIVQIPCQHATTNISDYSQSKHKKIFFGQTVCFTMTSPCECNSALFETMMNFCVAVTKSVLDILHMLH